MSRLRYNKLAADDLRICNDHVPGLFFEADFSLLKEGTFNSTIAIAIGVSSSGGGNVSGGNKDNTTTSTSNTNQQQQHSESDNSTNNSNTSNNNTNKNNKLMRTYSTEDITTMLKRQGKH